MIVIEVDGQPQTQGSKTAFPVRKKDGSLGVGMRDGTTRRSAEQLKSWRSLLADAAREEMGRRAPMRGPVHVDALFTLQRPKSHYRNGKHSHLLKPSAPTWHSSKRYDREKLARAVFDALTGIVWEDDGQICDGRITKRWGSPPGVLLVVEKLTDAQ